MKNSDRSLVDEAARWGSIVAVPLALFALHLPLGASIGLSAGYVAVVVVSRYQDPVYGLLSRSAPSLLTLWYRLARILWHRYARLAYVLILAALVLAGGSLGAQSKVSLVLLALLAMLSIPRSSKERRVPEAANRITFEDTMLQDLVGVVAGEPDIDEPFGNPPPSLRLKHVGTLVDSFVVLKGEGDVADFELAFDAIIKPGAILNAVFRLNQQTGEGYMARLDTRRSNDEDDSFLIKTGPETWQHLVHSRQHAEPESWHRVRLVVRGDYFQLFRNDILIVECHEGRFGWGNLGFFNELGEAHVDNVSLKVLGRSQGG
jgi:hypothetical protein